MTTDHEPGVLELRDQWSEEIEAAETVSRGLRVPRQEADREMATARAAYAAAWEAETLGKPGAADRLADAHAARMAAEAHAAALEERDTRALALRRDRQNRIAQLLETNPDPFVAEVEPAVQNAIQLRDEAVAALERYRSAYVGLAGQFGAITVAIKSKQVTDLRRVGAYRGSDDELINQHSQLPGFPFTNGAIEKLATQEPSPIAFQPDRTPAHQFDDGVEIVDAFALSMIGRRS